MKLKILTFNKLGVSIKEDEEKREVSVSLAEFNSSIFARKMGSL